MDNSLGNRLKPHLAPVLFLLTAVFVTYGRSLGHEFLMTWDDRLYVVHNEAVQGITLQHLKTIFTTYYVGNYAPVQMLSYMLDHELWGLRAGGFVFSNLIIHCMNGLLLYRLILRCHATIFIATIAAAFFLLHPVQVESVVWISQRKNLLAMLFFLLSWEWYDRYRTIADGKNLLAYFTSLAAFVLSLLAKSVSVIFPLVIVWYDLCYPAQNRRFRFVDKIPYLLAAIIVAALTIYSQQPADDGWGGGVGGGVTGYHGGTVLATFLTMLTVLCRYIGMLVWPVALSAAYEPVIHQSANLTVVGAVLLLAGAVVLSIRLFKADRKAGFWGLLFFTGLLPVSQIVPLVTLMNDRYLYFPMLGAAALFGYTAAYLHNKLPSRYTTSFYSLLAALLIALSLLSFQRTSVWRNDISIGRDTVAKAPNSYAIWEGLGEAYYFATPQRQHEAVKAFTRALELAPTSKLTLYNLGVLYLEMNDFDRSYELISRLLYYHSDHPVAWSYLGDIYLHRNNYPEAEKSYRRALALRPDLEQAISGLQNLSLIQRGQNPPGN